jgi:UMF1 family MFS transporter
MAHRSGLKAYIVSDADGTHRIDRKSVVAFCLFDFANSAFTTIVVTFVFSTYFANAIAIDPDTGGAQWSFAMAAAGIGIALLSPIFGAIADQTGRRKPWLAGVSVICVTATALLWYARPIVDDVPWALTFAVIATVGFEMGMLFYNALLPTVSTPATMGRISGWAWGVGYAGGLLSLAVALFLLVQADPAPFGLDKGQAEHVRATSLLVAGWFVVFAAPLFFFIKEPEASGIPLGLAVRQGLKQLATSLRNVRNHRNVFRYLIAGMVYSDAVSTIFALGGVYAGVTFGMKTEEIILLGLSLNVTAGLGAFAGGWIDDRVGSKKTIVMSLMALILTSAVVMAAQDKHTFWIAAAVMSTFFGPVQAASRTLMARLSPPSMRGEMFGLFALSGKVTAFVGPAVVGWVTLATGSYRLGMSTTLIFLIAGLLLLRGVKETDVSGESDAFR